jgi:Frog skin active peptide family signal and propeptide
MEVTLLLVLLLGLVAQGLCEGQHPITAEGREKAYNVTLDVSLWQN